MTKSESRTAVAWRWTLITSELLVVGYMAVFLWDGRTMRNSTGAHGFFSIATSCAWAFLFLGSPFLVRSQGWIAILGWSIAVVSLMLGTTLR